MLPYALGGIAIVNLVTFLAFGIDKWRARTDRRRTPEATLLTLSWATGFVGGWLGMSTFRHKTQKRSFQLKMLLVTAFNLLWPLVYLYTSRR